MSNLSQKDPPELSVATTGRSKCQRCREPILQGEQRAGVLTRTRAALLFVRAMHGAGLLHSVRISGTGQLARHGMRVCACQPRWCAVRTVYGVPWHPRRVGMVGRSSGISVRKWMKPNCFARNMRVDYAPTGRAKCNLDPEGPFIAKGEPAAFYAPSLSLSLSPSLSLSLSLSLPPTLTPA